MDENLPGRKISLNKSSALLSVSPPPTFLPLGPSCHATFSDSIAPNSHWYQRTILKGFKNQRKQRGFKCSTLCTTKSHCAHGGRGDSSGEILGTFVQTQKGPHRPCRRPRLAEGAGQGIPTFPMVICEDAPPVQRMWSDTQAISQS